MIKYHGTPIGGSTKDAENFLLNRWALVPLPAPQQLEIVKAVCNGFILDNGAYTVWRKGGKVDFNKYLKFVGSNASHPRFNWAIIPDVIGGSEHENDSLVKRWPKELKGVPVFHLHQTLERLKYLGYEFGTVAIGGSHIYPNLKSISWWNRIKEIFDFITDASGRPPFKIHGLRLLDKQVFTKLPLDSADSTNAARNSGNFKESHTGIPRWKRAEQIAARFEHLKSADKWTKTGQLKLF